MFAKVMFVYNSEELILRSGIITVSNVKVKKSTWYTFKINSKQL